MEMALLDISREQQSQGEGSAGWAVEVPVGEVHRSQVVVAFTARLGA